MFMTKRSLLALLFAAAVAATTGALAAGPATTEAAAEKADEATRARALLDRAVARLKEQGERALGAFSRVGEFTDGDLYVYILGMDGVMQSSAGSSISYIGRNMLEYRDPDGKKFFQEMVDGARTKGGGRIEYRWLNLQHGKVERKVTYYQAVDNRIAAVGYYAPRATAEQAKSILWRAADEVKRIGPAAFEQFNDLNGGFVRDDTYVFVVGFKDMRMHAHGAMPRLVGRNVADLADDRGTPIIRRMADTAKRAGEGSLEYYWRNPVTGQVERKRSFFLRVGDYLVAVGHYEP